MIFEQLNEGPCKTYLIASESTREAILVDPVLDENNRYLKRLAERGLRLRYVADTHVHADHISGAAAWRDKTGVDYIMHQRSVSSCANLRVQDGDTLTLGDIVGHWWHTPGHTQDSLCLVLADRILTGDFLFIGEGGAGRTDLPGGDAGEHWDALRKLNTLPDTIEVYPGHDYHGRQRSTMGEERQHNPRLAPRTRMDYVDYLNSQRLGPATWMANVIRANYACATAPGAAWIPVDQPSCEVRGTAGNVNAELVRTITVPILRERMSQRNAPLLIDVRDPDELKGELAPIAGALSIPLSSLANRLSSLEQYRSLPIVTVCRSGGRSSTAAAILMVAGFSDVTSLEGGMLRWRELADTSTLAQVTKQPQQG